jgi:hypothetical protein
MVIAKDRNEINEWRRIRFLGWMQYATNTTEKPQRSVEDFMPLPGDPQRERGEVVNPDDLVRRMQKFKDGYGNPTA